MSHIGFHSDVKEVYLSDGCDRIHIGSTWTRDAADSMAEALTEIRDLYMACTSDIEVQRLNNAVFDLIHRTKS